MVKIVLDPGHGGSDPGAVGNGLKEKNLTLKIVKYIKSMLEDYKDVEVFLTRGTDKTLSLEERTDFANAKKADFLCSVHINAGGGEGYEDFVFTSIPAKSKTADIQRQIHNEVTKTVSFKDRGCKTANFHMLRETSMPAVLTENGFIDNASDAKKLKDESFIIKIAKGHVDGIVKAFGLKLKDNKKVENKSGDSGKIMYQVVAGSFAHYDNAENYVKSLKGRGIAGFIQVKK